MILTLKLSSHSCSVSRLLLEVFSSQVLVNCYTYHTSREYFHCSNNIVTGNSGQLDTSCFFFYSFAKQQVFNYCSVKWESLLLSVASSSYMADNYPTNSNSIYYWKSTYTLLILRRNASSDRGVSLNIYSSR